MRFAQGLPDLGVALLDGVETAILMAEVAQGHFFVGNDVAALRLASAAVKQAQGWQPLAQWIAGLSAFRLNKAAEAAKYFEGMLDLQGLTANQVSAAAFWAARSHLVAGQHDKVSRYLVRAALQRTSFYGLLALGLFVYQFEFGQSILSAGLTLALLILPALFIVIGGPVMLQLGTVFDALATPR